MAARAGTKAAHPKRLAPSPGRDHEPRHASVHEAKTHLSRLLDEVAAGGSVIITRRGHPVAKLEPLMTRRRPVAGSMRGLISIDDSFFDPLPDEELKAWNCE